LIEKGFIKKNWTGSVERTQHQNEQEVV